MILEATADDVPALSELAINTYVDAFGSTMSADLLSHELSSRSEGYFSEVLRHDTVLVYREGDRLLGYVQIGDPPWPEVTPEPGDQAVHRLYVLGDEQGRGIGRRLMEAALSHQRLAAGARAYLQVWERNERAIGLYRSLGFEVVGSTTWGMGDEVTTDELIMVKPLSAQPATASDSTA